MWRMPICDAGQLVVLLTGPMCRYGWLVMQLWPMILQIAGEVTTACSVQICMPVHDDVLFLHITACSLHGAATSLPAGLTCEPHMPWHGIRQLHVTMLEWGIIPVWKLHGFNALTPYHACTVGCHDDQRIYMVYCFSNVLPMQLMLIVVLSMRRCSQVQVLTP
jgi:hypothetical protein